tara:strand:+ start:111 stop:527 length:417 start_codon:yes stop_codon:yes gene_type:complete
MNVHLSSICNGCSYHEFPYQATPPISGQGKKLFKTKDDVNAIIGQLINEAEEWNKKGKNFDVALSVTKQLPFFCCPNLILSKENQKAIQRYVYCNETGTQAYSGSYGEQPHKWLQQYFILKQAFAQKEKAQIDGRRKD